MISKTLTAKIATGALLGAQIFMSCAGSTSVQEEETLRNARQDSLIEARISIDPESALTTIDSLEKEKSVSLQRLSYYRALAYDELGKKNLAENCCQKALLGDVLKEENLKFFYKASDIYSSMLSERNENELALDVATRGYEEAQKDSSCTGREWTATLLHDKGYCEMMLGKTDEAEQSFSMAYIITKQMISSHKIFSHLQTSARITYNIVDSYTSTGQYEKAKAWLEEAEEAVADLVGSPKCSKELREDYIGGLTMQKALILVCTGETEEADKAYQKALKMDYAQTGVGILERATYLEKAERWNELKALLPQIDSLYNAWGTPEMMGHWKQYNN